MLDQISCRILRDGFGLFLFRQAAAAMAEERGAPLMSPSSWSCLNAVGGRGPVHVHGSSVSILGVFSFTISGLCTCRIRFLTASLTVLVFVLVLLLLLLVFVLLLLLLVVVVVAAAAQSFSFGVVCFCDDHSICP